MNSSLGTQALNRYSRVALTASTEVIRAYSTSFSLANRLLPPRCREAVAAVYALVRLADEIVDGVGEGAGLSTEEQRNALLELRDACLQTVSNGFSTNMIIHAFAITARRHGIDAELINPFFESMEMDLQPRRFDLAEQQRYVYGSAEVVGLMCLRIFLNGQHTTAARTARLEEAARALGAAFQNVNFLRDLSDDADRGRHYLPSPSGGLDESDKYWWVERIRADLTTARVGIRLLPKDCRVAVAIACNLFSELNERLATTPVHRLRDVRVSVPTVTKLRLVATTLVKERR